MSSQTAAPDGGDRDAPWYRALAEIIDDPTGADLPGRLGDALSLLVPFELVAVFVNRGGARPLNIYDNFDLVGAQKGIAAYIENTYVLNPFFQAQRKGIQDGVYRIRDLAPDAFFESEYYKSHRILPRTSEEIGYITEDWPEGLEEIDIAVTIGANTVCEISVYRSLLHDRGFRDDELSRLSAAVPVLRALLRRYWSANGCTELSESPGDGRIEGVFTNFGKPVLTDREREVVQLILRGHSSESIGFNLGISLGTVKTHRRSAYGKLEISSQSELLSLFLTDLQATGGA